MPITQISARESAWPAHLDRMAMLDMKGLLRTEKAQPVRPPVKQLKPAPPPIAPPPPVPDNTIPKLQGRLARAVAVNKRQTKRNNDMQARLKRRDLRVKALMELVAQERAEKAEALNDVKGAREIIADLEIVVANKNQQIRELKMDAAAVAQENQKAKRALEKITLRAHDWLELREGKRVVREIRQEEATQ